MQEINQRADCALPDLPEGPGGIPPCLPVRRFQDTDKGGDRGLAVLRDIKPRLAGDEIPDRPGVVGRPPPEFPENGCGRSPDVSIGGVKSPDKGGDRRIADLPEGVESAELHITIIAGERCDEGRHSGPPDTHERGGSPGLRRIVPERGDQRRDCIFTYQGEGFGDAPPPPVVRTSEGLNQGSHGIGSAPGDGIHSASPDFSICTAEVVDERLHRAVLMRGKNRSRRFVRAGIILRQAGIEFDDPGRRFISPVVEPEQSHEFLIAEGLGARGRSVIQRRLRRFIRIAGHTAVRAVLERKVRECLSLAQGGEIVEPEEVFGDLPDSIRPARSPGGEVCTLPAPGDEVVEPPEALGDLLKPLKDTRLPIGPGVLTRG